MQGLTTLRLFGRLPNDDYVVLPLLSLLTICVTLLGLELAARWYWPEIAADACEFHDETNGFQFRPNCRSFVKAFEGPLVSNQYNECGFRTAEPCSSRLPKQLRVAVIGTSVSRGYLVPYPQTFAALATQRLTELCARPIDFQNLATESVDLPKLPRQTEQALSLKPDAIVMAMTAYDVQQVVSGSSAVARLSPRQWVARQLNVMRLFNVLKYFRNRDPAVFLDNFLKLGATADYLRAPLAELWAPQLRALDDLFERTAQLARHDDVPIVVMFVPLLPQVLLAKPEFARPGVDPFQLSRLVGTIAQNHGIAYADDTLSFAAAADVGALFYRVDGHPNGLGHALIAADVVAALRQQGPFAACSGGPSRGRGASG
jgi:hypothetical protein